MLRLEWDGGSYWHIARYGWARSSPPSPPRDVYNDLAFFPLFPGLIHGLNTVLPIGPVNAALVISWIAAAVAAWGVYAVGELLHGRRVGLALAALWALLPACRRADHSSTESLMTAFAAWALYAALTHRWLTAGRWPRWPGCAAQRFHRGRRRHHGRRRPPLAAPPRRETHPRPARLGGHAPGARRVAQVTSPGWGCAHTT